MKKILLFALLAWAGWHWWSTHAARAAVMLAPDDPVQTDLVAASPFAFNGYQVTPLADFHGAARVLSAASYRSGREAELAPVDLALGWGPMSVGDVLGKMSISQHDRRYYYSWQGELPIAQGDVVTHSANMHMIPQDAAVQRELERVRADDVVEFDGQLVAIQAADGWQWRSSTTRSDTGDGACEVVLLKSLRVH